MNRGLHRRAVQALRAVVAKAEGAGREEAAQACVRIVMETASAAAGIPVSSWAMKEEIVPRLSPSSPEDILLRGSMLLEEWIPREDWQRYPELAGWMYQYMLEEYKDVLFARFKKGSKAAAEDIPAVTQLFTMEWIARYMAENTVGRIWLERNPHSPLRRKWRYYDNEAGLSGQAPGQSRFAPDSLCDWKLLDPACGCGHLLTAAFDVLLDLYIEAGYSRKTAARLILERNLFGLDIDPLAVRLCRFVLLMKGAAHDPELVVTKIRLGVADFAGEPELAFGSLERPSWPEAPNPVASCPAQSADAGGWSGAADILRQSYHAVITNPPYLGRRNMNAQLAAFLDERYPRTKNDLFAAFLERGLELALPGGYHAAINQHAWMFLSGYEQLRARLLEETSLVSVLHLGTRAFEEIGGEVVQSVCFILRKEPPGPEARGVFWKLVEEHSPQAKETVYLERTPCKRYIVPQMDFMSLPGNRIAYELPVSWLRLFRDKPALGSKYAVKKGMDTGCNEEYVRYWHEVDPASVSFRCPDPGQADWFPYAKGGGPRRWYGNHYYVVRWTNNGQAIRQDPRSNLRNAAYYGKPGITWSTVSTGNPGFRLLEPGFLFDNGGSCLFPLQPGQDHLYSLLAYLNSRFVGELLGQLNPTLNIQPGDVARLPLDEELLRQPELQQLGLACVELARRDWNEMERSWNYNGHPAVEGTGVTGIEAGLLAWRRDRQSRRNELFRLEREIDRLVYAWYGLKPLNPAAAAGKKEEAPELKEDLQSVLSFAAGGMMNQYPIGGQRPFAGGSAVMLERQVLPRFRQWLKAAVGETEAEAGLKWVGTILGCRGKETAEQRIDRFFRKEWYGQHVRSFEGKPLYLRISSGPTDSFLAFVPVRRMSLAVAEDIRTEAMNRLAEANPGMDQGLQERPAASGAELVDFIGRLERLLESIREREEHTHDCSRTIMAQYASILK